MSHGQVQEEHSRIKPTTWREPDRVFLLLDEVRGYLPTGRTSARSHVTSIWIWRLAVMLVFVGAAPATTFAQDRSGVAIPHRALWPDSINSPAGFDRASRAEILVFAHALADSETLDEDALKHRLGVDAIDMPSVRKVRRELWNLLNDNYAIAAAGCTAQEAFCPTGSDPNDLRHQAEALSHDSIQPRYRLWFNDATQFHLTYLNEFLRLAALFPRANSEVEAFNDNELRGWGLQDRHFLLSFDDGPTGGPAAEKPNAENTDLTLDMLRQNRVNAVFFAIGEAFQARLRASSNEAMQILYSGMCVGSHGWLHKSHAEWPQWRDSIESSSKLIHATLPDSYVPAFRPPFGQRPPDSGPYFASRGLRVVLWNIDSHDWQDEVTADDVEQRVMSLMLLWRRGLILFHDFFPKARTAVPHLISWSAHDDITWIDCHSINWSGGAPPAAPSPAGE